MDAGCVAPCETVVVSWVDLTGFELRLSGVPARPLFCPGAWGSHWNLLLNDCLQHSETPRALAPGAEMQWVRALSKRKRESTAEGSPCRRAPLVGNSIPHLPNQRGNPT